MSMSKKDFIALADHLRIFNMGAKRLGEAYFTDVQLHTIADFCRQQNPNFKRDRWLSYIAGECSPNGGSR